MTNVTPQLLESVQKEFNTLLANDLQYLRIIKAIENGNLSWAIANQYSIRVGELLSLALTNNITTATLPNGIFYFNIADEILRTTLSVDYDMVSGVADRVQQAMNEKAKIGIKPIKAEFNENRTKGLIDKVSNAEQFSDVEWVLKEPIVNYSQSIVDDTIEANAKFHAKAGLRVTVERTAEKGACEWCVAIAEKSPYRVSESADIPREVFQRHERCRCHVSYNSVRLSPYKSSRTSKYNTFRAE